MGMSDLTEHYRLFLGLDEVCLVEHVDLAEGLLSSRISVALTTDTLRHREPGFGRNRKARWRGFRRFSQAGFGRREATLETHDALCQNGSNLSEAVVGRQIRRE